MIGRSLALISANISIIAQLVEIAAIIAGVAENAVQNQPNTQTLRQRCQTLKIGLVAKAGVDMQIIRRVILMIAGSLKNRVQINAGNTQTFQIK